MAHKHDEATYVPKIQVKPHVILCNNSPQSTTQLKTGSMHVYTVGQHTHPSGGQSCAGTREDEKCGRTEILACKLWWRSSHKCTRVTTQSPNSTWRKTPHSKHKTGSCKFGRWGARSSCSCAKAPNAWKLMLSACGSIRYTAVCSSFACIGYIYAHHPVLHRYLCPQSHTPDQLMYREWS